MKIAIAAEGSTLDSKISVQAGRAAYYLIVEDKEMVEVIKNPFAIGGGGAGWSVAYMLAEKGVDLVIAGKIGPNMAAALKDKGLDYKEESEKKASEAIN